MGMCREKSLMLGALGSVDKYREVAQDLCSRAELWCGVPALLVTKCDSWVSNVTSDPVSPANGGWVAPKRWSLALDQDVQLTSVRCRRVTTVRSAPTIIDCKTEAEKTG